MYEQACMVEPGLSAAPGEPTDKRTREVRGRGRGMRIGVRGRLSGGDANDAVTTALLLTAAASSLKKGRTDGRTDEHAALCAMDGAHFEDWGKRQRGGRTRPNFPYLCSHRAAGEERGGDDNGIAQKMASSVASLWLREKGAVERGRDRGSSFFWNLIRICVVRA